MPNEASRFYSSIKDAAYLSNATRIDAFVYFLTEILGGDAASAKQVEQCFRDCSLAPPSNIAQHLSRGLKSKPKRFVKGSSSGYKLERHMKEDIAALVGAETTTIDVPSDFLELLNTLPDGPRKAFLREAIDCFGVHSYRATIVMVWLLTLDHLFDLVLSKHVAAFNTVLASNTDRRVRITAVNTQDDFGEIPEGKFIEFCRSAGVISNDVRKILDQKLGTRNSAAHPSGVKFGRAKAIDFVEDLLTNVIQKYPV